MSSSGGSHTANAASSHRAAPAQLGISAAVGAHNADRVPPETIVSSGFRRRRIRHSQKLFIEDVRGQRLNRKSWPVEVVAESGDMVGDNDEVEDVNDDPLGRPSVWSSFNRGLLAPSGRSITSPYSSPSTSPEVSSKSATAGGADAGSGTNKLSPPPSTSPL